MVEKKPPIFLILNQVLQQLMGWRRIPFVLRLIWRLPGYRRRFSRTTDDVGLRTFKRRFLLAGALYHELVPIVGVERAFVVTHGALFQIANWVQRSWYIPPPGIPRTWDWLHREHHRQMSHGLISHNKHDEIQTGQGWERFHITRCRFFETFRDMEVVGLTEVFCKSDEIVFNEYSPAIMFHRDENPVNTIARGAAQCTFVFEKRSVNEA